VAVNNDRTPPSPSYDPWYKGNTKLFAPNLVFKLHMADNNERVEGKKRKRTKNIPMVACEVGCTFCVLGF
jgi:hypothetical protein